MKKVLLTMCLALFVFMQVIQAQVSAYSFASSSGTYTEITGGTVLVDGTVVGGLDSWVSSAITIPSFTFSGVAYTTAFINSNGVITLGGTAPSGGTTTGVSSPGGSGIALCPFGADLDKVNADANTEIRWETVANEIVFQWKQFKRFGSSVIESFDMQVRLNTVNGVVSFIYNLNAGPAASTSYQPQVGIRTSAIDYKNRLVASGAEDWATSLPGVSNTSTCRFTSTAPVKNFTSGLTYTWTPPSCPGVVSSSFAATNPTTNSVDLAWTEPGTTTSWQIQYGFGGFTLGTGTFSVVGTNPYTLSGLTPASNYQVYIRSICGVGDTSAWKGPIGFSTSQILATFPFAETFETWPNGWTWNNSGQTNKWFVGNVVSNAGLQSAYITNDAGVTNAYTLTSSSVVHMYRDITFPAGAAFNLQFNWKGAGESTYDYMRVYLVPVSTPLVSGTLLTTGQIGSTNYNQQSTWQTANIELLGSTYASQNWRLVFSWKNDGSGGTQPPIAIDNISFTAVTCPAPSLPTASTPTINSIDLAWTEAGSATSWQIQYGVTGFTFGTGTLVVANTNPYTLGSLTPATTYQAYVRSICGVGDTSTWKGPIAFTTQCMTSNVPYFEGFESITANNQLPACMVVTSPANKTLTYIASDQYNRTPKSGTKFASFAWAPAGNWFFFAPVQLTAGVSYDANVWYVTDGATGFDALNMAYGDAQNSGAMTQIATIANPTNTNYQQLTATFTPATTGTYYLGVQANGTSSAPWYLTIDDISITATPTCPGVTPASFTATNPTPNSVDLAWTEPGTATSWQIQYDTTGFTLGTGIMTIVSVNPYTLGSLTPATAYQGYIRSICSVGDTSAWKGPISFSTTCLVTSTAFTEGFEAVTAPPTCWTMWYENATPASGNIMKHTTDAAYNETKSFRFSSLSSGSPYQQYLSTPELNFATDMEVTFRYKSSSTYGSEVFAVGTSTDGTIWNWGYDITDANTTDWQEYLAVVPVGTKYVGIQYKSDYQYYLYIDEFSIHAIPTCPGVTAASFAASNPTLNSIDLAWTEPGTATQWQIEYGAPGFTQGTGTYTLANSSTYTLGGLSSGTNYQAYIRSICSVGDSSTWKGPIAFNTLCGIYTAPVYQNFDAVATPQLPICWTKIENATSTSANVTTSTTNSYNAPNSIRFYNSGDAAATLMLVSPEISNSLNTLFVKFFAGTTSIGSDLIIGTITDPTNEATFTPVDTLNLTNSFVEYSVFLDGITTTDNYIAFKHLGSSTYQYVYLDNISIDVIPTCLWVENLDVDTTTQTYAVLTWNSLGTETEWQVEYGQAGFTQGSGTLVTFNNNPDTIFGLQHSTVYEFYVRAICDPVNGDTSMWTGPQAFATECGAIDVFPYVENFSGATFPPMCWTRFSGVLAATSTLTSTTSGWVQDDFGNVTSPINKSARLNIYGSSAKYWLVTPSIDLGSTVNYMLTFNLALTEYALTTTADPSGTDDTLAVVISTDDGLTWSTANVLKLWDNAGSANVYNDISLTGEKIYIDLTGYTGNVKIAFYGISTSSNADNDVFVDDVSILEITPCQVPTTLDAINIMATSADLTWTGGTSSEWEIEWDTTGFTPGAGTFVTTTDNPYTLTGLAPEATYEFYVRANCLFDTTVWVGPFEFSTTATCIVPDSLDTISVTHDMAIISWYSNDTLWQIEWDTTGFVLGTGNVVVTGVNPYTISGLDELTSYDFYIRAICDTVLGDTSNWAGPLTFTTTTTIGLKPIKGEMNVNIYPNPSNGLFNIQMLSNTETLTLSVLNLQGQLVYEEQMSGVVNGSVKVLDLRTLAAGMYQIKLNDGKTILNKKLIIN